MFDRPADWTLLITSGEFGDKLPIGFRGCHAALAPEALDCQRRATVRPPRRGLVAQPPGGAGARRAGDGVRFFAPAMRNMLDRDCPVSSFAGRLTS